MRIAGLRLGQKLPPGGQKPPPAGQTVEVSDEELAKLAEAYPVLIIAPVAAGRSR